MRFAPRVLLLVFIALGALLSPALHAQRQMEHLGRGIVVLRTSSTQTYVGWRLLGNDPQEIAFNLYRSANGATAVKLNAAPITTTTNYVDTPPNLGSTAYTYSVRPVLNGIEVPDTWANPAVGASTLPAAAPVRQYLPIPLQPTPDDPLNANYRVNFAWVGDLDGDGEYDFVVERTNIVTYSSRQWIQAYKRDGTLLWQMTQGPNSTEQDNVYPGSSAIAVGHNDNVTVYDLDGDGKSEVIVLTANGVIFSYGTPAQTTLTAPDNEVQFISVIDGQTGAEKGRAQVPIPAHWPNQNHVSGHFGILYSDGLRPSFFFQYANRNADTGWNKAAATWDFRDGQLTQRWLWTPSGHTADGHQIRLADVDNDGRDEYVDIGHVVKADGSGQINGDKLTEVVHGDRFHVTDIDPNRPGLETFLIQQYNPGGLTMMYHSADKSAAIKKWYAGSSVDVGRGVAGPFVPNIPGLQMFSTSGGIFDRDGNELYSNSPFPTETIWWDGDLYREFLHNEALAINKLSSSDPQNLSRLQTLYNDPAASPGNYQADAGRPAFWGDILGDWREEIVCTAWDFSELRIYTTRYADTAKTFGGAPVRIYTLMHNPQYRIQATTKGYVQSSYPDYYLGYNMAPPAPPPMVDATLAWKGGASTSTWDVGATASWLDADTGTAAPFSDGDTVRFDLGGDNSTAVTLTGALRPGALTVYSPTDYTFAGTGSLAGAMKLMKAGAGSLTLPGAHPFTGATTIWDGALVVNGHLQNSSVTVWGGTWGGALAAGYTGGRLAGSGQISQPVTLKYRGAITPGAGMDSTGTLTLAAGLVAEDATVFALDLSNDPTGLTKPNDHISIAGNLALTGTTTLVINPLDATLGAGTYTLLTYTGTLTGSLANLAIVVPEGTPHTLSVGSGAITLYVPPTRPADSVTWRGAGSTWDLATSPNWLHSDAPEVFVSGDAVTFDDTGSAASTVTLAASLPVSGVTVDSSANYTFAGTGSISGPGGLTKSGTGTLTVQTTNSFTGPTTLTGGVLAVASLADAGSPSSIGASTADAANFVLDGGTLRLVGTQTNTNRDITLGASGGTFDITGTGSSIQLSGVLGGNGPLQKSGSGTLLIASANTYTGGTVIHGGKLYLAGSTANRNGLGTGPVTIHNGTLAMADVQNNDVANWDLIVPAGATARLDADGRCRLNGSLTGDGTLTFFSSFIRTDLRGNWSAFTGRVRIVGGDFRIGNPSGYANAAIDIGAGGTTAYVGYIDAVGSSGTTVDIGELAGSATSTLGGGPTSGRTLTWRVGSKNTDSLFAGVIKNGTGSTALNKIGSGTLSLSGASTHTGSTTVSAGKLVLASGSISGSAVTVSSGAGFGGQGSVTGNVTFNAGSTLLAAPTAGPLAITGNLTFGGAITVAPAPGASLAPGTYPLFTYTGTLTGSPAFTWSGTGHTATFDTSVAGQVNLTLTVPARLPADLVWTGAQNAAWDAGTENWTWTEGATLFQTDDRVRFDDTSAVTAITLTGSLTPATIKIDAAQNYSFSGTGAITGAATLAKSGTGNLTVSTAQTFTGGSTLHGGTVTLNHGTGLGTGTITLAGGTLAVGAAVSNPIHVSSAGGQLITGGSNRSFFGPFTGDGAVTLTASAFASFSNLTDFAGIISLGASTGTFRANSSTFSGGANWTLDLGNSTAVYARNSSAATVHIGALSGGPGTALNNGTTATTYSIGAKNLDTTFSGSITGAASLVKTGSATLTLAGANTYTGATTVSTGSLLITGSLATPSVTVASGATIGGTGTLGGGLTLASGARLALGVAPSATGGLTVSGATTLSGAITVVPTLLGGTLAPGTYPLINYTGPLGGSPTFTWLDTTGSGLLATFGTATAGQVTLTLAAPLTALQSWRVTHFGTTASSGDAADSADPDLDSVANLLEYALGTDPTLASAPGYQAQTSAGVLQLTFHRIADPLLTYTVQGSSNLASWDDFWTSTGSENAAGPVTVSAPDELSSFPRRFLRLRVSVSPP